MPTKRYGDGTKVEPTKAMKIMVFIRDEFRCQYCYRVFMKGDVSFSVDHIVPTSAEGAKSVSNLITACVNCNEDRASESFDQYVKRVSERTGEPVINILNRIDEQIQKEVVPWGVAKSLYDYIRTENNTKVYG